MKKFIVLAAFAAITGAASAQSYDFTSISSGSSYFTDGDVDTALTAINTGTLDRANGISLDSDNNTLVYMTRNGGAPFGDYLVKFDLTQPVSATNPDNISGNLDADDADDGDIRTGSGGVAISAGNGLAFFYDFQDSGVGDFIHTWNIGAGTYNSGFAGINGARFGEHIQGDNWAIGFSTFGSGELTLYNANTGALGATLATPAAGEVEGLDIVDTGSGFNAYFTDPNGAIFEVTDILGTPGVATDVTPAAVSGVAGLDIQDFLAVDSDTFIIVDEGNSQLIINDAGVQTTYTAADIATATGATNFAFSTFIFHQIEKREVGGDFELLLMNATSGTGTQAASEPVVVSVTFDASLASSVDTWNLYN